ncbi:hypothetical protein QO206_13395 [Leeuwenhoekiella aequorea]|uniref:hypothetical protein n=1 Tax=Leeuwenhoekiella aequorea TaxID=283736 RepID=UPI00352E2AF5|tara:strand:- start:1686 stop:2075 length:390 start_codon:yes stop_codon:yes gene_type:complete
MENHITKYGWSIKTKTNELVIRERVFKVLPKIKFKRNREKLIEVSRKDLGVFPITAPYTMQERERTRSWHGGGMQQDDVNCIEKYSYEVRMYKADLIIDMIAGALKDLGLPEDTIFTYHDGDKLINENE